ncbi:MAG: hypothetical protein ACXAC6_17815 [Candidatus Hodarchaeales archaeon]|jgi:type III secretory pathway component EscS
MQFLYLDQWENYIQGWQLLLESGDQIFWTILIFVAWVVRATSLIAFLFQLGDRLVRHSKDIEFTILRSLVIFLIVSVPFFLAGYPLIYPFIP